MKFGNVKNPEDIDFTLPADHPDTKRVLSANKSSLQTVSVGCAKWNKSDLKGFYPRGIKDELEYYATQFNSIELNATFYNLYKEDQILKWKERTPADFKFFPKLPRYVSHIKRLQEGYQDYLNDYLVGIQAFGEQLGMLFLQVHDNFGPKKENIDRLKNFIDQFPKDLPLAIELRHTDWFSDKGIADEIYQLFEKNNITNVLVDSAGRRDIMHMRLTTPTAFVRYVGANHESDYTRLDEWIERIKEWKEQGLQNLYFFIHQNIEKESPLLAATFIKKLNEAIGTDIKIPSLPEDAQVKLGI
ncbi:hypothetical protein C900_05949 [Fulvivirga imtechensis AK7]|uniref:DUF72 domain-containing protein n=1 Tax=Fulvivirga imtechensis AK7 TaxID=1237149 RepID=L8JIK6_9BACT|nr:DUF72 domain-containing protein [Fulvivirga imtechensis]ELR68660.1 hypothetical protein C900_05949 [Fulvivirga imtechensis AK7]